MVGLGYLYPSIRLGHILQSNSHTIQFISTEDHNHILANYGIEHFPIRGNNRQFLDLKMIGHVEYILSDLSVANKIINTYKPDVIVTSPLAIISFILAEKYQIPVINIGFTEYLFPCKSIYDLNRQWRLDKFTETYNSCVAKVGLPLINNSAIYSPFIGTKYLLRSVPTLNDDVTFPDKVEFVGDLYFEPEYINKILFRFISESKDRGKQIVYIQIGRLFDDVDFWPALLSVLTQLPMNFIVDIGRADYSTKLAKMQDNFFVSSFIPIGAIKDDIDFVICNGQTTSIVSAIVHGKQILSIPHSADSIELTKRLESKNLAFGIYDINNITIDTIRELFGKLMSNHLMPSISEYQKLFLSYTDDVIYEIIKSI